MVLYVTRKHPPSVGGMQKFSREFARAVSARTPMTTIAWGRTQKLLPLFLLRALVAGLRHALGGRVTLVHVGDPVLTPLGLILARAARCPLVVTAHGLDVTHDHTLYRRFVQRFLPRADHLVCISDATLEACLARGGDPKRCSVIPVGIDRTSRRPANPKRAADLRASLGGGPVLLTVGRLVRRKGVAHFIAKVLPRLGGRMPAHYVVVGDGPDRAAIERAVDRAGMSHAVTLMGQVDDDTLSATYAAADVFIMPNIPVEGDMEGFGLVAVEAGLAELPVVASDLEGIRTAVTHGRNGVLVPHDDPEAWIEAVCRLLEDPDARRSAGRSAREHVLKTCAWDAVADRYVKLYRNLSGDLARVD